jgi:cytochrome b6-f complex iron-sulfur subunit
MEESILSPKPMTRREFLYYIWAASAALLTVESAVGLAWFLSASRDIPRKETLLHIDLSEIPQAGSPPIHRDKRLWFTNTLKGFYVLNDLCTHRHCAPKWVPTNSRFECPCHGSKFKADGTYIEGPAPRNLDSFRIVVTTPNGQRVTPIGGGPVDISGATEIVVDLEAYIFGKPAVYDDH